MRVPSYLWISLLIALIALLPEHPRAQMPGEEVGYTYYVEQSNGACGNRIAVDNAGNIHVCWTRGVSGLYPRHIYYNYKSPGGWQWPGGGTQVSMRTGAGFPCLDLLSDNRAAFFYHNATTNNESLFVAVDDIPGQGFFSYYFPPNRLTASHRYIWPAATIDSSGRMHLVATWNNPTTGAPQDFIYTRSNDGGTTWTAITRVDTLMLISPIVVSSPVSSKVAIVYSHPTDTTSQMKNDIYYIMSLDGINWNWNNKVNVTGYGLGDSLFAYIDLDAVFDHNDRLHILWPSRRISQQYDPVGPVYQYHYVDNPGITVEVTQFDPGGDCGYLPRGYHINKMSLASSPTGAIYTVYTVFDCSDISTTGLANGELYAQSSFDGGLTWNPRANITNTPSPGCVPPDCLSEIYASMAEMADTALHIFYLGHRGGGVINPPELINHPTMYYPYPVALLGARDPAPVPANFTLHQNYPNPFNASTMIPFELGERAAVRLGIYDLSGRRVAVLFSGTLDPGRYEMPWHADRVPSGIYFARLTAGERYVSRRMILLK